MVVGSNAEPGRNIAVQGGALSSDARSITNGPQTQIASAVQHIRDGRSITNGPQTFEKGSQNPRTETQPSTSSQLRIVHSQGIVRDPEFGTQGAGIIRDPEFAWVLSSDGLSITNGPQTFEQGTHSVDISKVIQKISIVAGVGFILASFFKFHQHKQNPQQVQISQGISLLLTLRLFPFL